VSAAIIAEALALPPIRRALAKTLFGVTKAEKDVKEQVVDTKFNVTLYESLLEAKTLGKPLIYKETTTSTMNDADAECARGGTSGTVILAEEQTQGKGRKGRKWVSEKNGNLYFTFFHYLPSVSWSASLNYAVALAVCKVARTFGVQSGIKWPNDVLVDNKKICGMLVNCQNTKEGRYVAHVGVGINVNEDMKLNPDKEIQAIATSFLNAVGHRVSREEVLSSFFNILDTQLLPLTFSELLEEYQKYDLLVGKNITVAPKSREETIDHYTAKATGFTKEGHLTVILPTGEQRNLVAEEVMIRASNL